MKAIHRLLALPLASLGLLTACGGDDNDGTGPNPRITVAGRVTDRYGEPISGASVLVFGKSPVTSGSEGRFSIPGVTTPYDIALILGSENRAVVYKGLTRSDPTLLSPKPAVAERTVTISGTTPPVSDQATFVFFVSSGNVAGGGHADATTGQYAITVQFYDATNTHAGQLHVLRYTRPSTGLPASYGGYASKPLTISVGGDFSGNDFVESEFTDPPEQTISGTVTVPAGYTLTSRRLLLSFERGRGTYSTESGALPGAFTYAVPAVQGVTFGVWAQAESSSARSSFFKDGISGNSADVSLALESASQLEVPMNGATAVDVTTSFRWSQGGGTGVYQFEVYPQDGFYTRFLVYTTGTDGKIPDLARQGDYGLPASVGYRWFVYKLYPVASADDVASDGYRHLINLEAGDVGETFSGAFGFTTRAAAGTAPGGSAAGPRTATAAQRFHMHGLTLQPRAIPMDAP